MGAAIIFGAMAGGAAGGGPDDGQAADDGSADLQRQREELQAQVSEKYDPAGSDAAIQPADSGEAQPAASDPDDKDPHHWQPVDTGTFRATGAGPDYPDGYLPPGTEYERGEFTSDNGGTPYQAYRLPDGTVFVAPPETVPDDPNNQVVLIHGGLDRILDAKIADRMEKNAAAATKRALDIGRELYESMPSMQTQAGGLADGTDAGLIEVPGYTAMGDYAGPVSVPAPAPAGKSGLSQPTGIRRPPVAAPAPADGAAANGAELGTLSQRYEAKGPATVSTGKGDYGGVSYGSYQLASNMRRPQEFLGNEGARWAPQFGDADPNKHNGDFADAWKRIARENPREFFAAQHDYIKRTHYDPAVENISDKAGIDVNRLPAAVRQAVWSTAVQNGPANQVVLRAISHMGDTNSHSPGFSQRLINAIYDERSRKDENGVPVYFAKSSKEQQQGVLNRFVRERQDALQMLREEEGSQ